MKVFRDEKPMTEEDLYDFEDIELVKKQNKGLGFSIVSRKEDGVFISDIVSERRVGESLLSGDACT